MEQEDGQVKNTSYFVKPDGFVKCMVGPHERVRLPVVQGILKHPDAAELRSLLCEVPGVAEKYTREALKCAAWPILREFPGSWLLKVLEVTDMKPSRRKALRYLLS